MITLKNIGPIENVTIPVPADGGVVVLRGRNGCGKSTALDAIQTAITGKGKPSLRDKTAKGEIHAGGVSLTVAKSIRRSGELVVTSLDSRLSVADLVEPGIQDPLRADASRIKALVNLSRAEIQPNDLHGFPDNLTADLNLADPVAAMAELKKRLDIGAREYEKLAKDSAAKAAALLESAGNPGPVSDEAALQAALSDAQRRVDRLNDLAEQSRVAKNRAATAQAKLATIERFDTAELQRQLTQTSDELDAQRDTAQRLKEQYNAAVERYKERAAARSLLHAQFESAQQADALRAQLESQIAESLIPAPPPEQIADARAALETAMQAMTAAAQSRAAQQTRAQGEAHAAEAQRLEEESNGLRRKARQTEEILSEIIADLGCPLRCLDGRLITDTARGPTYYADLSEGERWTMALDIAVQALGERGLLVVPQAAWEGLDPANRALIAAHAKQAGVVIITAECDTGELAPSVFDIAA